MLPLPRNNSDLQPDDILSQDPNLFSFPSSPIQQSLSPHLPPSLLVSSSSCSPRFGNPNKRKSQQSFPSLSVPLSPSSSTYLSLSEHNKENIPPSIIGVDTFPFCVGDSVDFYCEKPVKKWVPAVITESNQSRRTSLFSSRLASDINKPLLFLITPRSEEYEEDWVLPTSNRIAKSGTHSKISKELMSSIGPIARSGDSDVLWYRDNLWKTVHDKCSMYHGQRLRGCAHGNGFMVDLVRETVIRGHFRFGVPHGFCIIQWKDGTQFQGECRNGYLHFGQLKNSQTQELYQGEFKNNQKHDKRAFWINKRKREFFSGGFNNGNAGHKK